MQEPYNNASYTRISTDESLIIPECVNWNLINSVGSMPTNYRDRLMTDNNDNSNSSCIDDSNVPRPPIYTQKRRQLKLKLDIGNISNSYDSDDSDNESSIVNVPKTIKIMDILYNTNFSSQLRSEQNISTISHYLKNIINKTDDRRKNEVYSIKKIVNVLNWMMQDWQIESIVKVIVNITSNWTLDKSKNKDDSRLGRLIRKITVDWDPQYIAHLVSILFTIHPLCNQESESCKEYKEVFLKVLSKRWKFCRLSQFFICLGNKGAINHKLKMHLLQRSAKFEDTPKKTNFNFSNTTNIPQRKTPIVMSTPQLQSQFPYQTYQSFQFHSQLQTQPQTQPQFQFQIRSQTQSVDQCFKQDQQNQNSNENHQIYQTVMILSPQTIVSNQTNSTSTSNQNQRTYYQIQDIPKPRFSQSPLNDNDSIASSSNSPPPSIITSTNIPMITIRSMNQIMTMTSQNTVPMVMTPPLTASNVQTVSMVMTPPLRSSTVTSTTSSTSSTTTTPLNTFSTTSSASNSNNNSPSMVVTKITTIPTTMTSSLSKENIICLPPGTSMIQTMTPEGTPLQTPNIITITSPPPPEYKIDSINNNSQFSSSSSCSFPTPPNFTSTTNSSSSQSSSHSKLKGKETTNQEEETTYYTSSSNKVSQSLLFMNPSTASSYSTSSSNPIIQPTPVTLNRSNTTDICTIRTTSSNSVNVSLPIPLSINVRNINQRIADLSLKAEKNNENETVTKDFKTKTDTVTLTSPTLKKKESIVSPRHSLLTEELQHHHFLAHQEKEVKEEEKKEEKSTSSPYQNLKNNSTKLEKEKEELTVTFRIESPDSDESTNFELTKMNEDDDNTSYYEEIFNLDDFNHEEKKAIYDIIDSSKEDLEEIQMKKDEKIRSFIQENKKEFSNLSSTPKTPPPSLASSPFFQK